VIWAIPDNIIMQADETLKSTARPLGDTLTI